MSLYCPCGRRCRGDYCSYCLLQSERRGPGRRRKADDIPAVLIERIFARAKAQQSFERRKHQRVSLDPGRP
jgi:hypothetical protein